jgi:hypothetical protein
MAWGTANMMKMNEAGMNKMDGYLSMNTKWNPVQSSIYMSCLSLQEVKASCVSPSTTSRCNSSLGALLPDRSPQDVVTWRPKSSQAARCQPSTSCSTPGARKPREALPLAPSGEGSLTVNSLGVLPFWNRFLQPSRSFGNPTFQTSPIRRRRP